MIHQDVVVSYAQFNEDIILYSLLSGVEKGFYIDVGANYPTVDSVTKLFYEKGWSGINIEPIDELYSQLVRKRPRDINLNCGVGSVNGVQEFYHNTSAPGHSSFIEDEATTGAMEVKTRSVKIMTLESLLDNHAPKSTIHFMKIDVEGFEYDVVSGMNWKKYRPLVLCIEANHTQKDWRKLLRNNSYELFIADGLNEYYVAAEAKELTEGYAERAVHFMYHSLKLHQYKAWLDDEKARRQLTLEVATLLKEKYANELKVQELKSLSLKDATYPRRLVRSLRGLTTDWIRYKLAK